MKRHFQSAGSTNRPVVITANSENIVRVAVRCSDRINVNGSFQLGDEDSASKIVVSMDPVTLQVFLETPEEKEQRLTRTQIVNPVLSNMRTTDYTNFTKQSGFVQDAEIHVSIRKQLKQKPNPSSSCAHKKAHISLENIRAHTEDQLHFFVEALLDRKDSINKFTECHGFLFPVGEFVLPNCRVKYPKKRKAVEMGRNIVHSNFRLSSKKNATSPDYPELATGMEILFDHEQQFFEDDSNVCQDKSHAQSRDCSLEKAVKSNVEFNPVQISILEVFYAQTSKNPQIKQMRILSRMLHCDIEKVWEWFAQKNGCEFQCSKPGLEFPPAPPNVFPESQLSILVNIFFTETESPSSQKIQELANTFNCPLSRIRKWFYRRRILPPIRKANFLKRYGFYLPPAAWKSRTKELNDERKTKTLRKHFDEVSKFPSENQVKKLSRECGIVETTVINWFKLERDKERLQAKGKPDPNHGKKPDYQSEKQNAPEKPVKRTFRFLNEDELKILREEFEKSCYPTLATRCRLEKQLGITTLRLRDWFRSERDRKCIRDKKSSEGIKREKRTRYKFTTEQKATLDSHFSKNKFPSTMEKSELSQQLSVSLERIDDWFMIQRGKDRKARKNNGSEQC